MSGYGPEFARGLLREIDQAVASLDAGILEGRAEDYVRYRVLVAERRGLLKARAAVVDRLDDETRLMLGLPERAQVRARAAVGG